MGPARLPHRRAAMRAPRPAREVDSGKGRRRFRVQPDVGLAARSRLPVGLATLMGFLAAIFCKTLE